MTSQIVVVITFCSSKTDMLKIDNTTELSSNELPDRKFKKITILLPTVACDECIKTGQNVISHYASKTDWDFYILPNENPKQAKIIYHKELSAYDNVMLDSTNQWTEYSADLPNTIWVLLGDAEIIHYKFTLTENTLNYLKDQNSEVF